MDNSALNKAHQHYRRAESHLRCRRFNDAIECHKTAATLLEEALKYATNRRSIDSIKLQIDFHTKQKNIIVIKQQQFEAYKKDLANKRITSDMMLHANGLNLKTAIYEKMEEADSLLERILSKDEISDSDSVKSSITTDPETIDEKDVLDGTNNIIGTKHPKDDRIVIEEFKILNKQLHLLVAQLVTQLESSAEENKVLRHKVQQLECEKVETTKNSNNSNNLKVTPVTDSSGCTSPYVFSPHGEFSPDFNGENRSLPVLAPLEMPNFDYSSLISTISNLECNNMHGT